MLTREGVRKKRQRSLSGTVMTATVTIATVNAAGVMIGKVAVAMIVKTGEGEVPVAKGEVQAGDVMSEMIAGAEVQAGGGEVLAAGAEVQAVDAEVQAADDEVTVEKGVEAAAVAERGCASGQGLCIANREC